MLSQIETAFHAREESEAAAHHSEERMRRFVADAGHELRTPLTAIRGFAEYYRQRGGLVTHWDRGYQRRPPPRLWRAGSPPTTWTGSCSGWRRKRPDGAARRGPAAAGPARSAAAAGQAADRPALAGRRRGARRPAARPVQDHRPVGAARRRVPGHRRRAAAAAGHREPDEQTRSRTPGRNADRGVDRVGDARPPGAGLLSGRDPRRHGPRAWHDERSRPSGCSSGSTERTRPGRAPPAAAGSGWPS